ncbi:MAG: LysE family translocator [Bacteroidales bacterium]|nr:LysE family translocator [Bacteroidales bacterium]
MTSSELILWFTLMSPIAYSAGPNNIMCATLGGRYGFRKAIPFILGINTGILIYSVLIGFGVGKLFETHPEIYKFIKYAGSAYILFLAYTFYRSSGATSSVSSKNTVAPGYFNGIILNLLNPKGITALLIMYSQFLTGNTEIASRVFILSMLVLLISISSHILWTIGGNWLTSQFNSSRSVKIQGIVFGTMLVIVAVWMLF